MACRPKRVCNCVVETQQKPPKKAGALSRPQQQAPVMQGGEQHAAAPRRDLVYHMMIAVIWSHLVYLPYAARPTQSRTARTMGV